MVKIVQWVLIKNLEITLPATITNNTDTHAHNAVYSYNPGTLEVHFLLGTAEHKHLPSRRTTWAWTLTGGCYNFGS
jgi:hypothetical protein